ncbi:MAG: hypothetical protein GC201_01350 [Alphaproteobacteria bacterium]|nr:hypothetical protein [Alphaproteobacteria bacterium]
MSGNPHAYELLMVGVGQLVTGTGSIQERLLAAVQEFHALETAEFPSEETRHKFAYLMKALGIGSVGRDQVATSLADMSDDQAAQYARRIYDLFLDAAGDYFRSR